MGVIYGFILTLFFYLVYKIRFKNFRRFKIYLFRKWINYKSKRSNIISGYKTNDPLIEKSIQIWKLCVKQKNSELHFSYLSKARQVKLGEYFLMFTEVGYERGIIKVHYNSEGCSSYYECYIKKNHLEDVVDYFDLEVEKRMRVIENQNKSKVISSLDSLIQNLQK